MKLDEYRKCKYKDNQPTVTVRKIRNILNALEIRTDEKCYSPGIDGLYSCRITIHGTEIVQNGKGTTPEYALALGYAEFIERLSTGFLVPFEAKDKAAEGYPFVSVKNDQVIYIPERLSLGRSDRDTSANFGASPRRAGVSVDDYGSATCNKRMKFKVGSEI